MWLSITRPIIRWRANRTNIFNISEAWCRRIVCIAYSHLPCKVQLEIHRRGTLPLICGGLVRDLGPPARGVATFQRGPSGGHQTRQGHLAWAGWPQCPLAAAGRPAEGAGGRPCSAASRGALLTSRPSQFCTESRRTPSVPRSTPRTGFAPVDPPLP